MTPLATQSRTEHLLPNRWHQVSVVLQEPIALAPGNRLGLGEHVLAPWRINHTHIDCLVMPSKKSLDLNAPLLSIRHGKPLSMPQPENMVISAQDLGIADAFVACQILRIQKQPAMVLLSAESFPFVVRPAKFMVSALPHLIAACPLLEDWGFANRLASTKQHPGCLDGTLAEILNEYSINQLDTIYNILFLS